MVADRVKFLHKMKELELYLVEFDSSGQILEKIYPDDYQVVVLNKDQLS